MDSQTAAYTHALVEEVRAELGADVVGVYLFGSVALDDYHPPRSDLDVAVVAARTLTPAEKEGLARRLDHRVLPCPARKLELVVYERGRLARGDVSFELDLNTGPGLQEWRGDPKTAPTHWFVLDVAIARERAPAILGPPASSVFPEQPRSRILEAVRQGLDWHLGHPSEADPADTVLNACRGWRFVAEGRWSSKTEAGRWAAEHGLGSEVVGRALALREGAGPGPTPEQAIGFAREARAQIA